jgi:hypothetical protein
MGTKVGLCKPIQHRDSIPSADEIAIIKCNINILIYNTNIRMNTNDTNGCCDSEILLIMQTETASV